MKIRASLFAISVAAASTLACAESRRPVVAPSTSAHREDSWPEYELIGDGVYIRFPSVPVEIGASTGSGGKDHALTADGTTSFSCARIGWPGGKVPSEDQLRSLIYGWFRGTPEAKEEPRLGGFSGVTYSGANALGGRLKVRAYMLGDGMVVAKVWAPKEVDETTATRFFDSIRLTIPWRIRTIPEVGLVVAVPAWAVENSRPMTFGSQPWTGSAPMIFVVAGGRPMAGYQATAGAVDRPPGMSDASLLEHVLEAQTRASKVLSSTPIEYEGALGRELLVQQGESYARARLFTASGYLYGAFVTSPAKERVLDDDSKRFLESLRWYEPECPPGMKLNGRECVER